MGGVFTAAALQKEVDAAAERIASATALLAALQRAAKNARPVAGGELALREARRYLADATQVLNDWKRRRGLVSARAELAKARRAARRSAEFVRAGREVFRSLEGLYFTLNGMLFALFRASGSLELALGEPVHPPPTPPFTGAWIETQIRAEHGREIDVVGRELQDARKYAETRALIEGQPLPDAVTAAFGAAVQHVATARRELADFVVAVDARIPIFFANRVQRELGEARADVVAALAALDRDVAPNTLGFDGRLRDATAALDAAEAQIQRGETYLANALPLPSGLSYAAALRALEREWQQIDLHGATPHRTVRRYHREEQVAGHRARNHLARARREYLAAARAQLRGVRAALVGSPTLTPAVLTRLNGNFVSAEANRRAVREELIAARVVVGDVIRRIRPARAAARARQPATEPVAGTVTARQRTWATRVAKLGKDLVAAELAWEAELAARPPAVQPAGARARAREAQLRAARSKLDTARRELEQRLRFGLMFSFVVESGRWPLGLAQGFRRAHQALREAQSELALAQGIPQAALIAWRDRSAADLAVANAEAVELAREIEGLLAAGRTVPAGANTALGQADRAIHTRRADQGVARDTLNRAVAQRRALGADERARLLGQFLLSSSLDAMLEPLVRGFRALETAAR